MAIIFEETFAAAPTALAVGPGLSVTGGELVYPGGDPVAVKVAVSNADDGADGDVKAFAKVRFAALAETMQVNLGLKMTATSPTDPAWAGGSCFYFGIVATPAGPGVGVVRKIGGGAESLVGPYVAAPIAAGDYLAYFEVQGSSPATTLKAKLQRVSDGLWLDASGVFLAGERLCCDQVDTGDATLDGEGRAGLMFFSSLGGSTIAVDAYRLETLAAAGPTPGALTFGSSGPAGIALSSAAATGGTAPYAYRWRRRVAPAAFADLANGSGVTGATTLALFDGSAVEGDLYDYQLVTTDAANETATSATKSARVYPGGDFGGTPGEIDDVTAQEIIDGVLDALTDADGCVKADVRKILGTAARISDGTCQAGSTTGATLAADAPAVNLVGWGFRTVLGAGANQFAVVATYNTTSKALTFDRTLATALDATTQYLLSEPIPGAVSGRVLADLAAIGFDAALATQLTENVDAPISEVEGGGGGLALDSGQVTAGTSTTRFTASGAGLRGRNGAYKTGNRAVHFKTGALAGQVCAIANHVRTGVDPSYVHEFTLSEALTAIPAPAVEIEIY